MTSSPQPTISPTDRVSPQRGNRTPKPQSAAKARSAPTRRPWLAATLLSVGTLAAVAGGFAGWQMLTTGEMPKPRMAAIKLGPLPEMPDLRNGVPALMPSRGAALAVKPAAPQPNAAQAEDANRKAMASTVASANLRPALAAVPAIRAEAEMPKPAPASVSASTSIAPAMPTPVRQVEIKRPTETASIGVDAKAPVAAPAAVAPAPAPQPAEAAREPAPAAPSRVASLPVEAPLPPRKPALQAPEAAQERAAERPAAPKPRPVAAQPRPASPPQAVASAEPPAPRATAEEDRSILGVPVPRFVPTGRDIRDAAASVGNAITSIPDNF